MSDQSQKLKLPRLQKVKLRRFSLFAANPDAEFSCGPGVLCLVGANGIGKSTLLSAVNFCLTGIVSDPNRAFESMEEYYKFTRAYSANYFRGRIDGSDEEEAEITVWFSVGANNYEVRRGLFEPTELRGLRILDGESEETVLSTDEMLLGERHEAYAKHLVRDMGLASFVEFVFLQHFVFSFDEQRKTLFWNPRIMERALYRAFGFDPNMAKQADALRRDIQREDSRVRNRQWEATRMRKRINEIRARSRAASGAQGTYDALIADHEGLSRQFDEESRLLRSLTDDLKDATLAVAEQSARESALRDAYAKTFEERFRSRGSLLQHPLILESRSRHICGLCGSSTDAAQARIAEKLEGSTCPLCDSKLAKDLESSPDSGRLAEIDGELSHVRKLLRDLHSRMERLRADETAARLNWEATKVKLDEFDRANSSTLESLRQMLGHGDGELALREYRGQLAAMDQEKQAAYEKREELKKQLLALQGNLERQYLQVERTFVPSFSVLAQRFLGMPMAVQIEAKTLDDLKLVVTVRGSTRREQQNLSESQRFFLDIALRMALTQHMSDPSSKGSMYIDTPEGSLDIAYEKRAGDMLAIFASEGHQIIMTANLNSSKLLLALAHEHSKDGIQLVRMTDWAELSEVQQQEEGLFEEAYRQIEEAMGA
jgi:DNA repair exonuclease SbcCD ATPase subunit